ncbi:MAG: MopE-related protein [Myxococcales bacterium]
MKRLALVLLPMAAFAGCNCGEGVGDDTPDSGRKILRPDADEEIILVPAADSGVPVVIGPDAGRCENLSDLVGCPCSPALAKRPCYTAYPPSRHLGQCEDGTQVCTLQGELAYWGPCVGEKGPEAEVCADLLDHNCNGLAGCADPACNKETVCLPGGPCSDPKNLEGCACATLGQARSCFAGPAASRHVGVCVDGSQMCVQVGELQAWSPCQGGVLPSAESCTSKLDDDCDGTTDCLDPDCKTAAVCVPECQNGATAPCYTGPAGTSGVGVCKPGTKTCANEKWGVCTGQVLPGTEGVSAGTCRNGADDDCDRLVDCEETACSADSACLTPLCNANEVQACYTGPASTRNKGICRDGSRTCAADGMSWGPCTGSVLPGLEGGNCADGADNDCSGAADCSDVACATALACCTPNTGTVDMTIWAHSASTLYQVNPATFATTTVGSFGITDMTDLAVTPDGTLYGVSFSALYRIDKTTGTATYVAPLTGSSNNGLTFLTDGTLLASDSAGSVKRINPNNGTVTDLGTFGNGLSSSGDLVAVQGVMYGISSTGPGGSDATSDNVLLRVDTTTGVATPVGAIGYGNVWGLAYVNGRVIAFSSGGQLIEVDPQTGKGTLLSTKNVAWWGAGQSPLTPVNPCP